jgi:HK97 family phage portal protein
MRIRAKPKQKRSQQFLITDDAFDLLTSGYTRLDQNPEIMTGCRRIAELIAGITIHLMENTENGDKRVINALSKKIDINPNSLMTRSTWMQSIIMNLLLYGNGNSVVNVSTKNGYLEELTPIPADLVSFVPMGSSYLVNIGGQTFQPDEILHFVLNPDPYYLWMGRGLRVSLKDVADNLKQASKTEKGFMASPKPSLIIKVDALTEEFANKEGRQKLLESYIDTSQQGTPWMIPAEQFAVEQIKPLSLSDLAISDMVQLDRRTVASILGVPPFLLGVGEYNQSAWNSFVNTTVRNIVTGIEQEMTRKLIDSPHWYVKFNVISLLDWDIRTLADVFGTLSDKGIVTGNEVRDRIGMSPLDGLDELRILENYIPLDKIGKQKKLKGSEEDE